MKAVFFLSILFISGISLFAQNKLEVDGMVKVSDMAEANDADSVVVWRSDGILSVRNTSTLNLSGWMLNLDTTYTLKQVGIGTPSPIILGSDRVLELVSDDDDFGSIIQLSNKNRSHYMRIFGGRMNDPHPLLMWSQTGDLRFVTDQGGYSEKFRIGSDGLITAHNRITNVDDPVDPQDAATKAYIDLLEATIKNIIGVKDIDNNRYETVTIGTQTWMAENLKATRYNDGTTIPLITDDGAWTNAATNENPAYTWYNNGSSEYGALYNWYAIDTLSNGGKNVCPIGWYVPTNAEWTILTTYLGGTGVGGGKLKETGLAHWNLSNDEATNASGFSGLPGGVRNLDGSFLGIGEYGGWWSSTENNTASAWYRGVVYNAGVVDHGSTNKGRGFSVRCVRDD